MVRTNSAWDISKQRFHDRSLPRKSVSDKNTGCIKHTAAYIDGLSNIETFKEIICQYLDVTIPDRSYSTGKYDFKQFIFNKLSLTRHDLGKV